MGVQYRTKIHSSISRYGETWWAQIEVIEWRWFIIPLVETIPVEVYLSPKDKDGKPKGPGCHLYGGPFGGIFLGAAYDCKEDLEAAIAYQMDLVKSGQWRTKYSTYTV